MFQLLRILFKFKVKKKPCANSKSFEIASSLKGEKGLLDNVETINLKYLAVFPADISWSCADVDHIIN